MRVIVNVPESAGADGKLPLPTGLDKQGRRVLMAPIIGALIRLSEPEAAAVRKNPPAATMYLEVESLDVSVSGIWLRECDLGKVMLASSASAWRA